MKLTLNNKTSIYILCPANIHTGGPKCLHQLGYEIKNKLKNKVYMFYFPLFEEKFTNPVHENYQQYKIPLSSKIEDTEDNILIIPEMNKTIQISKKFKNIQKVLWWLSIDFFLLTKFNDNYPKYIRSLIKIPYNLIFIFNKLTNCMFGNLSLPKYLKFIYINLSFVNVFKLKDIKLNLTHSIYQENILKQKGIKSLMLSDFIDDEFFEIGEKINLKEKKNIVCYNPKKSSFFMKKIIDANPKVEFVPLINLSKKEIIETLLKSKIYVDFGFHPGQDQMPREAAILKNCIITNKEGSASHYEDVSINNEFKFDEKNKNLAKINIRINELFNNYNIHLDKFENYRKKLKDQKKTFKKQIEEIFNL